MLTCLQKTALSISPGSCYGLVRNNRAPRAKVFGKYEHALVTSLSMLGSINTGTTDLQTKAWSGTIPFPG